MAPIRRRKIGISLLIPFVIVAMVFGALIWKKMHDSRDVQPVHGTSDPSAGRKAVLFFVADGTRLAREGRELPSCRETAVCVKELLDELFSGPVGELDEAVPEGAALNSVRIDGPLAIVDVSAAFAAEMPSGSSAEMLAVYSIVNTVCFNYPQITRVRITVDGNEKTGLSHLYLGDPLTPDYSFEQLSTTTNSTAPVTSPAPAAKKGRP